MIYLVLLIYLLCLVLIYDVQGKQKNKQKHFYYVLLFMIFVVGLRFRLGTDTVIYMDDFKEYPKLQNLSLKDFTDSRYQPFWIILNSVGKSLGDFVCVQFLTATLHIGILGYALKRLCPSLIFSTLFMYYLFDFTRLNMEVMRESIAIGIFLLFILAINDKKIWKALILTVIATNFHVFALPVFGVYWLYYKFIAGKTTLNLFLVAFILLFCIVNKDFMADFILNTMVDQGEDGYNDAVLMYANSEMYGQSDLNWKGTLLNLMKPIFLIIMMLALRKKCKSIILINNELFSTAIWLAVIFSLCKYSMPIMERPYNYMCIFTCILYSIFYMNIVSKVVERYKICVQIGISMCLAMLSIYNYHRSDGLAETERYYSRYYPYSSVFDQTEDKHRERIFNNRFY